MNSKIIEMPCIVCPMSGRMTLEYDNDGNILKVSGNTCKRGETYVKNELTNPVRVVTSTVKLVGGRDRRLPVITKGSVPKDMIFDIMKVIHETKVCTPVKENDMIVANICGTGIDLVASRSADNA